MGLRGGAHKEVQRSRSVQTPFQSSACANMEGRQDRLTHASAPITLGSLPILKTPLPESVRASLETLTQSGFAAMLAGGCVRDRLLGLQPKDFDIATNAVPDQVTQIFEGRGIKVVPTGVDHGTVTLVWSDMPIEVTTLRKDVSTDGRRAVVAFGTSFEEDAARRDFTINAMYEDGSGKLHDFFDGVSDLKARRLRFVGDPQTRIREDYLRILRWFRFWSRFDFTTDAGAQQAVRDHASGLRQVSQERITHEMRQMLSGPAPGLIPAATAMRDLEVLQQVPPECSWTDATIRAAARLGASTGDELDQRVAADPRVWALRFALLMMESAPPRSERELRVLGQRLRFSRAESELVEFLVTLAPKLESLWGEGQSPPRPSQVMDLADSVDEALGPLGFTDLLVPWLEAASSLRGSFPAAQAQLLVETEFHHGARRRTPIPILTSDLMRELGLPPGKIVGEVVRELTVTWRNLEWQKSEEGLALARAFLQTRQVER